MISAKYAEILQEMAPVLVNMIPGGMVYYMGDLEKITVKIASSSFDVPAIHVGTKLRKGGGPSKAIEERRMTSEKIPTAFYGQRIVVMSVPVVDDQQNSTGCLGFIFPKPHPVATAFDYLAPIISEMFYEGAYVYRTDREKYVTGLGSQKFDFFKDYMGNSLANGGVEKKALLQGKVLSEEANFEDNTMPVRITAYPISDEDEPSKLVGTFGIVLPRKTVTELREMSNNLSKNLEEISAVIQEVAASASDVSLRQRNLNESIGEIRNISEDINGVLGFIKQIADETKMLGLNASIEAARAGELGRGFGVVAAEIRKLSDESKQTVTQIKGLVEIIKTRVDESVNNSEITLISSEEQAAATEEMSAGIQEIASISEKMNRIAEVI